MSATPGPWQNAQGTRLIEVEIAMQEMQGVHVEPIFAHATYEDFDSSWHGKVVALVPNEHDALLIAAAPALLAALQALVDRAPGATAQARAAIAKATQFGPSPVG